GCGMSGHVGYPCLYPVRPEIVSRVAVVIALDVHRILRCHRESAPVRYAVFSNANRVDGHVAERGIHQLQNVPSPADPVLTRRVDTTVNPCAGRGTVRIGGRCAVDLSVQVRAPGSRAGKGIRANGTPEAQSEVRGAKLVQNAVLVD